MRGNSAARWLATLALAALGALLAPAYAAAAFDPAVEASNFSKTLERQRIYGTPQYQALLRQSNMTTGAEAIQTQLSDPERNFVGDLCWSLWDGCAGDVRLNDWRANGYGIVRSVLFTARNGATLSGHVWAIRNGPAKRAGIVITNGSVQADEQMYWYAAQALAKAGYVVLTWDPQGQGQSDTFGQSPDRSEGFPAQTDGRPFFDGTEDAIDFFLSTPAHPYEPVPSCTTGTSHAPKQNRRVAAGLDAAYNPYWDLLDSKKLGIAGHSYGAAGVSYVGQWDPRVKAIVAWDNLGSTDPNAGLGERPCPHDPATRRVAPITKPALGISADYGLPPTPNFSQPNPGAKSIASHRYTAAGVDSGEIIIRGGSHLDFSFIPNQGFGASLRGPDLIDWYTTAWFDKYVRGDAHADRELLTDRWRNDAAEGAVDPKRDGNMFSFYYPSRLDIHLRGGGLFDCEDIRAGCDGRLTSADGLPGVYDYFELATTPDSSGVHHL
jgi:dienelactone hydrolase